MRIDRSMAWTCLVSAPTEMKSTPVSAIARTFRGECRPRPRASAARRASDSGNRRRRSSSAEVIEQHAVGARSDRLAQLVESLDLDFNADARGGARRCDRGGDRSRGGDVILLDQHRIVETHAVVARAAAAHGVLLRSRSPGMVLRVSRIWQPVPATAST